MGDTNYFSGTVKFLNNPTQKRFKKKSVLTKIWVEISQPRDNKPVLLIFWGNLGDEVKKFYQVNDYLFIEGYMAIQKTKSKLTKIGITGSKVYPLFLTSKKKSNKNKN